MTAGAVTVIICPLSVTHIESVGYRQTDQAAVQGVPGNNGKEGSKEHHQVSNKLQSDGQPSADTRAHISTPHKSIITIKKQMWCECRTCSTLSKGRRSLGFRQWFLNCVGGTVLDGRKLLSLTDQTLFHQSGSIWESVTPSLGDAAALKWLYRSAKSAMWEVKCCSLFLNPFQINLPFFLLVSLLVQSSRAEPEEG